MAHRKVTVTIQSITGVPKDNVTNTFHFTTPTPSGEPSTTAELEALRDAVVGFYDHQVDTIPYGGVDTARLSRILSGFTLTPTLTIRIYRCETEISAGLSPEPIITYVVNISAFTGAPYSGLPTEVAACLSFKGVFDNTIPAARQRGRVFVGPLHHGVLAISTGRVVLGAGDQALLAAAGNWLRAFSTAGVDWVVWSGTELQAFPVAAGWVDNAFDTQRRRGTDSTNRRVW